MKGLLILFPLCLGAAAFAQDEIITRNGDVIQGKVQEITQNEIKYKKTSNPDGPLYTLSKSDMAVVEYKNGTKDVFAAGQQDKQPQNDVVASNTSTASSSAPLSSAPSSSTQVNNYYSAPVPRPNVNVVLGMGIAAPYWGWGWNRAWGYYRPYYHAWGWGGGCCRGHYGCRR